MPSFGLVYPLWNDRADAGDALERAAGEIGPDHLTIPVVTGPVRQVRFVGEAASRLFQSEGGWHYHPEAGRYENTRLRPRTARWLGARDALGSVVERARKHGMRVAFRIEPRGVEHLIDHHPYIRCKNAWGDETPDAGACPSNPDVRELLRAAFEELAAHEPVALQTSGWEMDAPLNRTLRGGRDPRPFGWHPAARSLLDVCFCESCRQIAIAAGLDAEHAARSVRVHFDRVAALPAASRDEAVEQDQLLRSCRDARQASLDEWLHRVAEGHGERRCMMLAPLGGERRIAGGWTPMANVQLGDETPEDLESTVLRFAAQSPAGGLALPYWRPLFDEAGDVVRLVTGAAEAGVRFFDFEGLHETPPIGLTGLRQAVRFARRRG